MDPVIISYLHGQEPGEYFGASLASGDLNNDGFDDLTVGAPHHNDKTGRVYVFLGSQDVLNFFLTRLGNVYFTKNNIHEFSGISRLQSNH